MHLNAGVPECGSADICSGMQECRSAGVQTFAFSVPSSYAAQPFLIGDF